MKPFIYRPPWPDELARYQSLLIEQSLLRPGWHPRVWSVESPDRFVGAAIWQLAGDGATAHAYLRLLPRYHAAAVAREMLRPLFAEVHHAGARKASLITAREQPWREIFPEFGVKEYWTDESWAADPAAMRARLARFEAPSLAAVAAGWNVRPLGGDDWALVEKWGVAREYFSQKHFEQMRATHRPALSGVAETRDGVAGLLVATQQGLTAVLEFITGNPELPSRWPLASVLLLRRLVAQDAPGAAFDSVVLNTNLHAGRAMHTMARRFGMRLTKASHHFYGPLLRPAENRAA
ncbi:MAG TPA: hypothetical protein VHC95_06720 [Opitutales bacterium]|nr:hypothetical protein [Opitutales bacterium]